jgi:hypothetical protein
VNDVVTPVHTFRVRKPPLIVVGALVAAQFGAGLVGSISGSISGLSHLGRVTPDAPPTTTESTPTGPPYLVNLIGNSDFSAGTTGWYGWHARIASDPAVTHLGSPSLDVLNMGSAEFSAGYQVPITGRTSGRRFALIAWIYVAPDSRLVGKQMMMQFAELGGTKPPRYSQGPLVTLHPGWQRLSDVSTVTENDRTLVDFEPFVTGGSSADDLFRIAGPGLIELPPRSP